MPDQPRTGPVSLASTSLAPLNFSSPHAMDRTPTSQHVDSIQLFADNDRLTMCHMRL